MGSNSVWSVKVVFFFLLVVFYTQYLFSIFLKLWFWCFFASHFISQSCFFLV